MAERLCDTWCVRSSSVLEGSRHTALLVVTPQAGHGFPVYYAVCENRSFRDAQVAQAAADKALADMSGLEADGTPVFPEGYSGFDDDVPAAP